MVIIIQIKTMNRKKMKYLYEAIYITRHPIHTVSVLPNSLFLTTSVAQRL